MVTGNMGVRPFISALLRNAKTKGLTTVAVRCREKGQSSFDGRSGTAWRRTSDDFLSPHLFPLDFCIRMNTL
jgi:hypothetical protein